MGISTFIRGILPATILAMMLTLGISTASYADPDNVTVTSGIVDVDRDGTVVVLLEDGDVVVPTNGKGLLQGGQIMPGDVVDVKIVENKKHRHRGHVTVLK